MDEVAHAAAVRESSVKAEVGWRAGVVLLAMLTVVFSSLMMSSRNLRKTSHPSLWCVCILITRKALMQLRYFECRSLT